MSPNQLKSESVTILDDGFAGHVHNSYWPQFTEVEDTFLVDGPSTWLTEAGYINFVCTNGKARYRITALRESLHSHTYELVSSIGPV